VLFTITGALTAATALFAVFYDPFEDVRCWATCSGNAFLIASVPWLAGAALMVALALDAVALAYAMVCALRDATVRRSAPWVLSAVAATTLVLAASLGLVVASTTGRPGPGSGWGDIGQAAWATGGLVLGVAMASHFQLIRRRQTAIDEIVRATSGAASDSLEGALQTAVGDPTLSLGFRLAQPERFVDSHGAAWKPPATGTDRKTVAITRHGRSVAAIAVSANTEIEGHLGPALRAAIENESLRVELEVQLEELRAARIRIVAAQDERRRELERALHDGAQHRMTVLVLQLSLLADLARTDGVPIADDLRRGIALARAAIDDLRQLAHGVYPAILESGGLPAALATFAVGAPIAVELDSVPGGRVDPAVEMATYRFVVSAVEDASRRCASHAGVRIVADGGTLTVAVTDDAAEAPAVLPSVLDRVGAVGGTVHAERGIITGELPCE
jgi:signal transduction histidine kinase